MLFFKKAVLLEINIIEMFLFSCAESTTQIQAPQVNNQTRKAVQLVHYHRIQAFLTGTAESDPYGSERDTLRTYNATGIKKIGIRIAKISSHTLLCWCYSFANESAFWLDRR